MKGTSLFLLFAGWIVAVAAVALLSAEAARGGFVTAGLAIQAIGLVLLFRAHLIGGRAGGRL